MKTLAQPPSEQESPGPPITSNTSLLRDLTRAGVLVIAGLYTIGLLIVNLDLGRYGIVSLDLARSEYVLAGALWVFLMMASLALYEVTVGNVKRILSSDRPVQKVIFILMELLGSIGIFSFIVSTLSRGKVNLVSWAALVPALVLAANALVIRGAFDTFKQTLKQKPASLGQLLVGARWTKSPVYMGLLVLMMLGFYVEWAFPQFPREFGGGRKPLVQLFLSEPAPFPTGGPLPTSENGKVIGPVLLLRETEHMFLVSPIEEFDNTQWWPTLKRSSALGLDRRVVSAAVYEPKVTSSASRPSTDGTE